MEAGRLAPTARNAQQWKIIIIEDPELKNALVDSASNHQPFLKQAPVLLVACGLNPDYIMRCGHPSFLVDLAIVLDHISLQAVREGLGTCWIGSFYEEPVKKLLKIPPETRIVQIMSLGYPAFIPNPTPRKPVDQFFTHNTW